MTALLLIPAAWLVAAFIATVAAIHAVRRLLPSPPDRGEEQ